MEATISSIDRADIVCARAVAPLNSLLELCFPLIKKTRATGLFPKGKNVQAELDEAALSWTMRANLVESRTDSRARIVVLRDLRPRQP
jgi:16S rRNA (guanine527-N7)-methyltransferase